MYSELLKSKSTRCGALCGPLQRVQEPLLGKMLGGANNVECLFARIAHQAICGAPEYGERMLMVRMLAHSDGKDNVGRQLLRLEFTNQKSFGGGATFPDEFDIGTYYVLGSKIAAEIDAIGVDSGCGSTLHFQDDPCRLQGCGRKESRGYWDTAVSNLASIKRCVVVYAVPSGTRWPVTNGVQEGVEWLKGATDGFRSACDVYVVEMSIIWTV